MASTKQETMIHYIDYIGTTSSNSPIFLFFRARMSFHMSPLTPNSVPRTRLL
jgi:hypothetical protein